tara:strand:- start:247 stop:660 length:414 start_codon:yes stop_codon:yes gene_type:complete
MSNHLTQRYPIGNVVVARLRSQLFENSAIVASLMEGEEVTEEVIEEILSRLKEISAANSTLKTFNEHFGIMPKELRPGPEKKTRPPTPQPSKSPGIHPGVPQPPGPQELMKKLNSKATPPTSAKKGCKDCKKPRKAT